ncbi:MAG: hypothetical protein KF799_01475 [Bdellovibrionales bacterium]|nr:hypothetical protein [Bdellovibrionales bacterium]
MSLKQICQLLMIWMSLLAPRAWGETEGLISWRARVQANCATHFGRKLEAWPGIAPSNRVRLARALCRDERVFWPYASEAQPQLGPLLEEKFARVANHMPLLVGVIGPSARENSEALHAIRDLLYLPSDTLFRWRDNLAALQTWRGRMDGGLMGGVVMVDFDKTDKNSTLLNVSRTLNAMSHMSTHEMESYVLAIQSRQDVRDHFSDLPQITWVDFNVDQTCENQFR